MGNAHVQDTMQRLTHRLDITNCYEYHKPFPDECETPHENIVMKN